MILAYHLDKLSKRMKDKISKTITLILISKEYNLSSIKLNSVWLTKFNLNLFNLI